MAGVLAEGVESINAARVAPLLRTAAELALMVSDRLLARIGRTIRLYWEFDCN